MLTSFLGTPINHQLSLFDDDMFNHHLLSERNRLPNVTFDIIAHEKEYVIHAEIPGMKKEDIKVSVDNNTLTVSGEKKRKYVRDEANVRREESSYGFFQRSIKLPKDCDTNALKAKYDNGVLELTCNKVAQEKKSGKEIQID